MPHVRQVADHAVQYDRQSSDVASVWFDQLYQLVKTQGTAPPPASRIYGVTAVALYEAVVPAPIAIARWRGSSTP
jgi:hypothetical protein